VCPQKYQNGVRDPSPGRAAGGSASKSKRQCQQTIIRNTAIITVIAKQTGLLLHLLIVIFVPKL
ncbi:MAG: hypothetical protein K2N86_02270, partial [Rikenellaceae bacterium]|nr:hypothetical protein [Rikenellaceae bacterium]